MKNKFAIFMIIVALTSALTMLSCSDFLEEDNKTGQTADLTYSTKSGIEGLLNSCYTFARGFYGKEAGVGFTEGGTDLFYPGQDNKQTSLVNYLLTPETFEPSLASSKANNPCLDQYWELFYTGVDACNNALKYIPLCPAIDDRYKQQLMGEAYFLKAFYNFHIVNIWGDAPYNDAAIEETTTAPTREDETVIYDKILADLGLSIAAFETADYKKKEGKADYWAAKAFRARVLLYKASWLKDNASYALAKQDAEDVINSGNFSFYDDYAETWYMENEDVSLNKEAIFGITYSSDLKTSVNCIPKRYRTDSDGNAMDYAEQLTRTGYSRGGSAMLLMFVSLWNNGCPDISSDIFKRVTKQDGSNNVISGVDISWYSRYGRGFTRYLPSLYLWQTLEKYRATDQRTDATLLSAYTIVPGLEGKSKYYKQMTDTAIYYSPLNGDSPEGRALQEWAKNRYRLQFAYGGEIPVYSSGDPASAIPTSAAVPTSSVYNDDRYNNTKIGGKTSYPGIKKFLDWFDTKDADVDYLTHDISYRDAVVIRLAEMYLIKAECELATGGNALSTINQLRAVRAIEGKDNSRKGTLTIDDILEERAIELCGEQQRWFDLKRTGKLVEYVKARNKLAADNIANFHVYRPIPQIQMDAITNPGEFKQNEGYN